jgi:hypothetical protein
MRDYTYINGARYSINNIFRSLRFDIDRLDLNWVEEEKPVICRGLRIVDNEKYHTATIDGEDADNLVFSLALIFKKEDSSNAYRNAVDEYLTNALESGNYLITEHKNKSDGKTEVIEAALH